MVSGCRRSTELSQPRILYIYGILAELSPDTKVFFQYGTTMLYYDPSGSGVNLTIGKDAGYYHRDQPNAVWNQDRQPYGYAGVRRLFETLTEKVLQKGEKV